MRKNIFLIISLMIMMLTVDLSAETLTSTGSDECISYTLTANKSTISSGDQIQFNLEYAAKKPICSEEELQASKVEMDFSQLVNDGSDVSASFDNEILKVDIDSSGIVTISFNDIIHSDETLSDFGGDIVFTVIVGDVDDNVVSITDSVGNEIILDVNDGTSTQNTNKVSSIDYASVGSVIDYTVLVNGDQNHVDEFTGVDSASAGLSYVPGSFWVEEDGTWIKNDTLFTPTVGEDGHLYVTNTESFDKAYLLHYQMTVTSEEESYSNQFDATYDANTDSVIDDIIYEGDGNSWLEYERGQVKIIKLNENNEVLSGAEFDLLDADNNVVDHLVTSEDGTAVSAEHKFGEYTLIETKAPVGYELNPEPISVTLSQNDNENVVTVPVYNEQIVGQVELTKVNEDLESLSGVEFTIYDKNDNEVETIVTDDNGYALSSPLTFGEYYLKETKANEGYKLDETIYPFTISDDTIVSVNSGQPIVNYKYEEIDIELPIVSRPTDPDIEVPEIEKPEIEKPEIEVPEIEVPEVITPEKPEIEVPEVITPEKPEIEVPEVITPEKPEIEVPEVITPEKPTEEVEKPEVITPEKPTEENEKPEDTNNDKDINNESEETLANTAVRVEVKHIIVLLILIAVVIVIRTQLNSK